MKFFYYQFLLFFFLSEFFFSCGHKKAIQIKRIGNYIIEAEYVNDTIMDGFAKYYNASHKLLSKCYYINGKKEGPAINYWLNGIIKDSTNYKNDLLNGELYGYDSTGKLLYKKCYYFGLTVGAHYKYYKGNLSQYHYQDFDKNKLIICQYDSLLKCEILKFKSEPILTEVLNESGNPCIGLFIYFLNPPRINVSYEIGLTNKNHETKNERLINSNRLFLDTLLAYPEKEWNYYLAIHLESIKDSINKIYIQELKTEKPN